MKLTGHACTEALSEAEEARRGERAEDSAGGVRVERRVRVTQRNYLKKIMAMAKAPMKPQRSAIKAQGNT